jgi:hypothetical protein
MRPAPGDHRRVRPAHRPRLPGASTSTASINWPSAPSTAFSQPASTCRRSPTRAASSSPCAFSQASPRPAPGPARPCCRVSSDDKRPRAACACLRSSASSAWRAALLVLGVGGGLLAQLDLLAQRVQRFFCVSCCSCSSSKASASACRGPARRVRCQLLRGDGRHPATCRSRCSMRVRSTSPARAASACWRPCASQRCCQSASCSSASRSASWRARSSFLQLFQLRLGIGHRFTQHVQLLLVVADVRAEFGQRRQRFVAGRCRRVGQFALVLDLLFDAGPGRAADLVDRGLRLVQGVAGGLAALAAGFQQALGLALLGDQLFEAFLPAPALAQALQLAVQAAEFQRLPFGVLDRRSACIAVYCSACLAWRAGAQLLADFLAQVVEAVQVLAGVADAGFGFLAALLVLGDAGGFFQVDAQVLGRPR